ncbi:muscarinic acetylcholine receptor M5-like [Acanthaster planci]|uniref:Muscarinic acetylcholine receptor M5-like n=1 Tax=Acanthaster planci TaxID=133434 RepID=A0A8B7XGY3_ACAPL|nr:muscarinic acetylcholine receptor M5-like [Acanthaster planci]XP_022079382.1 muscarinic acetylcholine receptor M5-like [Acanthaster planci]
MDAFVNGSHMIMNNSNLNVCSEETPVFCLSRTVSVSIVLGIIAVVTVIGNIFVIVAYTKDKRISSTVANTFILSLSISDLIVGAVSIPLNSIWVVLGDWPFGKIPCQIWLVLDYASTNVAVITILFISLDRYWLLTKKLAYGTFQTHKRAAVMIIASWITTTLFYTLITFLWGPLTGVYKVDYDKDCELEPYDNLSFLGFTMAAEFFIPLLIITYFNAQVYINIKRRSKGVFQKSRHSQKISTKDPSTSVGSHYQRKPPEQRLDEQRLSVGHRHQLPEKLHSPRLEEEEGHSNSAFDGHLEGITIRLHSDQSQLPAENREANSDERHTRATIKETPNCETAKQSSGVDQDHRFKRREFKRHRKAAVTLSVLVGVFIVSWLPFYIASLLAPFCEDCVSDLAWEVVNYLLWCNSTVNPFLYALLVVRFRQNFLRYLGLRSCTK